MFTLNWIGDYFGQDCVSRARTCSNVRVELNVDNIIAGVFESGTSELILRSQGLMGDVTPVSTYIASVRWQTEQSKRFHSHSSS